MMMVEFTQRRFDVTNKQTLDGNDEENPHHHQSLKWGLKEFDTLM